MWATYTLQKHDSPLISMPSAPAEGAQPPRNAPSAGRRRRPARPLCFQMAYRRLQDARMNEDVHIDRIAEAGAAWEAAVRSYVRTWARPAEDGIVTPAEWKASEAERAARSAYEAARDEYRL